MTTCILQVFMNERKLVKKLPSQPGTQTDVPFFLHNFGKQGDFGRFKLALRMSCKDESRLEDAGNECCTKKSIYRSDT
jgi:hypothetical protein